MSELEDVKAERDALTAAPVGDWLLNWFGENAPTDSGYSFAQIADCANYIGKHLKLLAQLTEPQEPADG